MSDTRLAPDCGATESKPSKARNVTAHGIEVKAVANGQSIDWTVDGKKPEQARLKLDANSGAHQIRFDLDTDGTLKDRGLRFNCAYPIFVHARTDACPSNGVDEQIEVLECSREKLTIYDKNSGAPKLLRYQLNFVEKDGTQRVCDPIIDNGGTNQH